MQVIFAVADLARSPRPWGENAAWFADPDDNVVAVAQPAAVSSPTTSA
jgi:hypothetical protein